MTLTVVGATQLFASWQLALRAERKSPQTLKAYGDGLRFYLAWCDENAAEPMTKPALNLWVAELLEAGAAASTARARQLAVRRFSAWLAEEGEIPVEPFLGIEAPKLDERVVEPLTDDELRALLKACQPPKKSEPKEAMRHRRDEALVRVMFETGTRAGEAVALQLEDVDLMAGSITVRRGKGGKGRTVPIGPDATLALDRYLRLRRSHRLAETNDLWLGDRGKLKKNGLSGQALASVDTLDKAQTLIGLGAADDKQYTSLFNQRSAASNAAGMYTANSVYAAGIVRDNAELKEHTIQLKKLNQKIDSLEKELKSQPAKNGAHIAMGVNGAAKDAAHAKRRGGR